MARVPLNRAGARMGAAATRVALMVATIVVALIGACTMSACSSARPWINQPIQATSPQPHAARTATIRLDADTPPPSIVAAVTLSGGGARAAAFGLGVLEEDLDSVPLSFAVASSSSVPLLLSPMTVRNYAGSCPESAQLARLSLETSNAQARLLHAQVESYLDAKERPYLHLVDGGLTDNLGVRGLMDRTIAGGGFHATFGDLPEGSVRKVIVVSVDSERDLSEQVDLSDRVPSTFSVYQRLLASLPS